MLCIWWSNEGIKKSISFIFTLLTIKHFLANKGNLLLKWKHVGNVVWSFIKNLSFHNCSSSRTFCWTNFFKNLDFYFDGFPWKPLHLCVCIWYEDSFTPIKRRNTHKVTLRAVLEMLFMCLCPHWDISRASVCVCSVLRWAWAVTEHTAGRCGATYIFGGRKFSASLVKWTKRFFEAHNLPRVIFCIRVIRGIISAYSIQIGLGTETRYQYGTGTYVTGMYRTESERRFRCHAWTIVWNMCPLFLRNGRKKHHHRHHTWKIIPRLRKCT